MLARLKEYKELVAILAFFLGGFFWIDNQFPKKEDLERQVSGVEASVSTQVMVLKCLLEQYMLLTQLQLGAQETEKQVRELKADLIEMQASTEGARTVTLTHAMEIERAELQERLRRKRDDLAEIVRRMGEVRNELERQTCGAVTS